MNSDSAFPQNIGSTSVNFHFLVEAFPVESEYAVRAERYVFQDPNTSLLKSRQFAEFIAARLMLGAKLDPMVYTFEERVRELRRQSVLDRKTSQYFDEVRRRGNLANHERLSEQKEALAALMAAHQIAIWLYRTFTDPNFASRAFIPPPKPTDADDELKLELELLRAESETQQAELIRRTDEIADLSRIREQLETERQEAYAKLSASLAELHSTKMQLDDDQRQFEETLSKLKTEVSALSSDNVRELARRARTVAQRIGLYGGYQDHIPFAQLRFQSGTLSKCCKAVELLARSSNPESEFILRVCTECGEVEYIRFPQFEEIDIWIDCPNCKVKLPHVRVQMKIEGKVKYLYGFRCSGCYWKCTMSSLLPTVDEVAR